MIIFNNPQDLTFWWPAIWKQQEIWALMEGWTKDIYIYIYMLHYFMRLSKFWFWLHIMFSSRRKKKKCMENWNFGVGWFWNLIYKELVHLGTNVSTKREIQNNRIHRFSRCHLEPGSKSISSQCIVSKVIHLVEESKSNRPILFGSSNVHR